jgi:hypothetical protein
MPAEGVFSMGGFDNSWVEKFTNAGWHPDDIAEKVKKQFGNNHHESIWGVRKTGDHAGDIIGVCFSSIQNQKRIEKTLLGFPIGGDNSIAQRDMILPRNRIPG